MTTKQRDTTALPYIDLSATLLIRPASLPPAFDQLTRLAPNLCMRLNLPFERWHRTRGALPSFFAHGYDGRYRKPMR